MNERNKELASAVFLIAYCALLALAVWPVGEFPLNDDFAYSRTVKTLVEGGGLQFNSWRAMTLIGQIYWGALFCLPFGFSFLALRISTLVAGCFGVVGLYFLCRETGASRYSSLLAAMALASNPLWLPLSATFMTDIPFAATAILAGLFFVRWLKYRSGLYLLNGLFFALASVSIRQLGILLPAALCVAALFVKNGKSRSIAAATAAFAISAAFMFMLLAIYPARPVEITSAASWNVLRGLSFTFFLLSYLGIVILPAVIYSLGAMSTTVPRRAWTIRMLLTLLASIVIFLWLRPRGLLLPKLGNIIHETGIGPILLKGFDVDPVAAAMPPVIWNTVSLLAIFSLLGFFWISAVALKDVENRGSSSFPATIFCAAFLALNLIALRYLFVKLYYFDRYIISFMPFAFALILPKADRRIPALFASFAAIALLTTSAFTILAHRDYFAFHRARWEAIRRLESSGVSFERIDGGFEYNGWMGLDIKHENKADKSFWWVRDDEFVVTRKPIRGYRVIDTIGFSRLLPPSTERILILHRAGKRD